MRPLPPLLVLLAAAVPAGAISQPGVPFPAPFVVEQHAVDASLGGTPVVGETVRSTYAGTFLVTERPDGGRTIVDFSRREMTEVRPKEGTYWTLSFSRFTELRRRLSEAEPDGRPKAARPDGGEERLEIRVEAVTDAGPRGREASPATDGLSGRRLRASVADGPSLDAWVDPSLTRLTPGGMAALAAFEREVLGSPEAGAGPADLLDAVRRHEGGALVVRTRRPVGRPGATAEDAYVETVVTKVTALPAMPPSLVAVPEGLKRVPSPLETVVAWAEDEAAIRSGGKR